MSIQTFKRCEKKFLVTEAQKEALVSLIKDYVLPDKYCRDNQVYAILNIYCDSDDNDLIRYSVTKPDFKEKLRIRSYSGNPKEKGMVFIEVKRKSEGIVTKRRVFLPMQEAYDFVNKGIMPDCERYIDKQVLKELDYFIKTYHVSPKVFIGYNRYALYSKEDKDLRITFDQDVCGRRTDLDLAKGNYGFKLVEDGLYILEIKVAGALPLWLVNALNELRIYSRGFSKYGKEYEYWIKGVECA